MRGLTKKSALATMDHSLWLSVLLGPFGKALVGYYGPFSMAPSTRTILWALVGYYGPFSTRTPLGLRPPTKPASMGGETPGNN